MVKHKETKDTEEEWWIDRKDMLHLRHSSQSLMGRWASWMLLTSLLAVTASAEGFGQGWDRHIIRDAHSGADGVRLADVNGDQLLDIVTAWEESGVVEICFNPGPSHAADRWRAVEVGRVGDPEDAVAVDMDLNGILDVVSCSEGETQSVQIHWGPTYIEKIELPQEWTTKAIPVTKGKQWMFALPLDLDGLYGMDLVIGSKGPGAMVGWLQSPSDPHEMAAWKLHKLHNAGWIMSLIGADIDQDNDIDILVSDRRGSHSGVYWLQRPETRSMLTDSWNARRIGGQGHEGMFVDLSDFDPQPGWDLVAAVKPNELRWYRAKQDPFQPWASRTIPFPVPAPSGSQDGANEPPPSNAFEAGTAKSVRAGDLDGDGRSDLVVSCENAEGSKSGVFGFLHSSSRPADWEPFDISGAAGEKFDLIELLDLDRDGDLDVITTEERERGRGLGIIWYENPTKSSESNKGRRTPR